LLISSSLLYQKFGAEFYAVEPVMSLASIIPTSTSTSKGRIDVTLIKKAEATRLEAWYMPRSRFCPGKWMFPKTVPPNHSF